VITPPGSFGAFPAAIRKKADELRDQWDARPCPFTKYEYPKLLDESRDALAEFLNVPVSTVVFVPNATTGVNTVLRNISWNPDGKDEILQLNIIYSACAKTTNYICEVTNDLVRTRDINLTFPIEDADLLSAFKAAIQASRDSGRRPRLAIFDTVASNPGLRLPFEALTALCHSEKVLSLIDGAHGVGHVELNLPALNPDFFVSNCHKWLFTPRSCAVFYVPHRNQPMIRSPIPTSHGFVPRAVPRTDQTPTSSSADEFVRNFEFVGTADTISYLTVPEALKWRREVCSGEERIRSYCIRLAREGGSRVAKILGTRVLDNAEHTLTECCFANVQLPLYLSGVEPDGGGGRGNIVELRPGVEDAVVDWAQRTLIEEYNTFIPVFFFQRSWWVRLSGQVYLDLDDFDWAGRVLRELCGRVRELGYTGYD
jgi:selenocysteine lyase/cysteine desulfurase